MLQEESKFVTHRPLPPPIVKHLRRFFQKVLFAGILFTAKLTPLLIMLTPRNDTRNDELTSTIKKPFLFLNTKNFFSRLSGISANLHRLVTGNREAATLVLIYFA